MRLNRKINHLKLAFAILLFFSFLRVYCIRCGYCSFYTKSTAPSPTQTPTDDVDSHLRSSTEKQKKKKNTERQYSRSTSTHCAKFSNEHACDVEHTAYSPIDSVCTRVHCKQRRRHQHTHTHSVFRILFCIEIASCGGQFVTKLTMRRDKITHNSNESNELEKT